MKILLLTTLSVSLLVNVSCKKNELESGLKKIHTDKCGEDDRCIYTEAKIYQKNQLNRGRISKDATLTSKGVNVTVVDMIHIGPKSFFNEIAERIKTITPNTTADIEMKSFGRSVKRRVKLPIVQILEGTGCDYNFKIADFSKLKLPKLNLTEISTDDQYNKYKQELYKLNNIQDDSDISHLLVNKDCDKDLELSYNAMIPELNEQSDLEFQKQGESRWLSDLKRGMKSFDILDTKLNDIIASSGDIRLDDVKNKAKNIGQFIFMALATNNMPSTDEQTMAEAYAFGSYFNASNLGIRNQAAIDAMDRMRVKNGMNNFVLPWGANHNPHFEATLLKDGFRLKRTEKIVYARCSDFQKPDQSKATSDYTASESMYSSFCR